MILAFSRGFVLQNFGELSPFGVLYALAEGDGGGGDGGGGDGGGGGGGGGDGGGGDGGGSDGGGGDGGGGDGGGGGPADIIGCMDPSATNYNPAATSQTGVTCTYPIPVVYGCMDPSATNYNPAATSQTGVTCTYPAPTPPPPAPIYGCMDSTATNYNPAATSQTGVTCTYPPPPPPVCILSTPSTIILGGNAALAWGFSSDVTSITIDNGIGVKTSRSYMSLTPTATVTYTGTVTSAGGSATCSTTITVTQPVPVIGCMDSTATNYNPAATSQTGVTCTYPVIPPPPPPPPIFGCMDSAATNFNPAATTSDGSCTYPVVPPAPILGCMDSTATNYNPAATSQTGVTCTYPVVTPPPGGGGGGGGGGGSPSPTITLATLPHVSSQPLAYLYLSQIPYTGLDLGPLGTVLYWVALIGWALALAYLILFGAAPIVNRCVANFFARVQDALNAHKFAPAHIAFAPAAAVTRSATPATYTLPEPPRNYSSYDGFKSYARNGALSIDDIVKGLSKHHAPKPNMEPVYEKVEPVYESVEPIYENVEAIVADAVAETRAVPPYICGFTAALIEGDRAAVFAGLRQHIRGSGAPEQLITDIVCLLDDTYRSRIDGTACDPDIARLTARLSTPVLEKLVAALTTAIDSSYSTGMTGAKLALMRAFAVLGA